MAAINAQRIMFAGFQRCRSDEAGLDELDIA
jgi:hypothetical protein